MSLVQAFCNDPLSFMQDHVVYIIVPNDAGPVINVTIDERPNSVVENKPRGKVFRLKSVAATVTPSIPAYFCPYQQNALKAITLGNDALWMITPTMDGCTFAAGSQGGGADGTCRVTHVNTARAGTAVESEGLDAYRAQQKKMQHNLAISEVGRNGVIIEPDVYMSDGAAPYSMKSTTFGTHPLGRAWSFYTLRYRYSGNTFFHGGVHAHP
jgi:hypothetical protein